MNFDLSPDQLTLQRSLEQIAMRHAIEPSATYYASAPELEKELSDGGFFDIAHQEDMGSPEALLLVETIAALSVCIEVGTSALVAPHAARFGAPLPRPVAIFETSARAPVRFLPGAATALAISDDGVRIIDVARCSFETVQTPFGYPFGRLIDFDPLKWPIAEGVAPSIMRQWWRVALAGEIAAAADSAVALTVEHVLPRKHNPSSQWRRWFEDPAVRSVCTESLGNLLLVSKSQNERAGNQELAQKCAIYFAPGHEPPPINEGLRGATAWKPEQVLARERMLHEHADAIWNYGLTAGQEATSTAPAAPIAEAPASPFAMFRRVRGASG